MNETLSDERIDAIMAEFFPRTKSSPGYRGFARAVATAAVEADRQSRTIPEDRAALADELDDLDRALIEKCKKGVEYLDNGDPLKDVMDGDDIEECVRLLVRLAAAPKQAAPAVQATQEDLRRLVDVVWQHVGEGQFGWPSTEVRDALITKALGAKGKP